MNLNATPPLSQTPTQLIVGVDYDATCRAAVRHALVLGRLFNVPVHVLHACTSPYAGHALNSTTALAEPSDHNVLKAMQHQEVQDMQAFMASLGTTEPPAWSIESGDPKRVLLDFTHEHEGSWLVLGARKHAAIAEWLLGSTTNYVVRRCQAPVLVVPPPAGS